MKMAPTISLLAGYSIFVVTGTLPPCEANQVLSLVRAEPPLSPAGNSLTRHTSRPTHSLKDSREQLRSGKNTRHNEGKWTGKFFKHRHSPVKGEGVREEEQDLQMAMAMSVSLEQSQKKFEIDQQLQLHQQFQGAGREDPAFCGENKVAGVSDYREEEEEAALTAAICASLGWPTD